MKEEKDSKDPMNVLAKPETESTPIKFWKSEDKTLQASLAKDKNGAPLNIMEALKSIFGVGDSDLAIQILSSGATALDSMCGESGSYNVILQSLHDLGPKDAIEARLAVQAATLFSYGLSNLKRSETADMLDHSAHYSNKAVKLLRLHNETIEALNRYRRGGEQKVTVTHAIITEKAIVNNFNGVGGGNTKKEGASPCQQYAEPRQEPQTINRVVNQPWSMEGAACTEEKAPVQGRKKDANA